jgi:ribosomal-protein-alanine N-acetyltransferase
MGYILETERCRLREMREEDGPILYRLNSDPEVIRYTGDPPFESEAAATEFIRNYEAYKKYGMGRWLAERKDDGEILGWCGLKYLPGENQVDLAIVFSENTGAWVMQQKRRGNASLMDSNNCI